MRSNIPLVPRRLILGCLLLCRLSAFAATIDFSEIERAARAELNEKKIPGCAVAVVSGETIVFAQGFGVASVETSEPVRSEMLFRLGSTTKMFTSAAVVMLAEEGKLRLDSPVGDYVPGLNGKVGQVTAAQLLSHTAGVRDEAPMNGLHDDTALAISVRGWKEDMFFTEPGKIYSYSNPGYWLAGVLAETVDRRFYADVLDARIFRPLGMTRTTLRPTVAMTYPLAIGHEPAGTNQPRVSRPLADNAATWPAGQIFSSVHDLSRWCIALMHDGKLDGKPVLPSAVVRELTTPHADMLGLETKYGYGLMLGTWHGERLWSHSGSRAGYGSLIRMSPDRKVAVIILTNLTGASMAKTADKALEVALNASLAPAAATTHPKSPGIKADVPLTLAQCVGRYKNGLDIEELVIRNEKLVRRRGRVEEEVTILAQLKIPTLSGQTKTLAVVGPNGKAAFILIVGANGQAEFICQGNHALARQKD